MNLEKKFNFSEIAIVQKKCIVLSRKDIPTEIEIIRNIKRGIPLLPSNMSSVTNSKFCIQLYKLNSLAFLHRAFSNSEDYILETKKITKEIPIVAVSIGVKNEDYLLVKELIKNGANLICIDIANCYCDIALDMCKHIRKFYPTVKIVVGNTVNPGAIEFFNDTVDAIKIGCASGSCCETKNTSGCYKPAFSAIYDMKEQAQKYGMPLISDGGIREPADFSKSIGAGASAAMAGYIFARCPESASETIEIDGIKKKIMSGMASRAVQEKWRGKVHNDCPEGKTTFLDLGESVEKLLERYSGALRSGISYSGCNNIEDFRKSCEFILI